MSSFESAYESQLQGVSQQLPSMRLPGQVSSQDNMLSDAVTGVRRRPGAAFLTQFNLEGETSDSVLAWDTDIQGIQVTVIVGVLTGTVKVFDVNGTQLFTTANSYLVASNTKAIRAATVAGEFFLLNTSIRPDPVTVNPGGGPPSRRGYFYVVAGTFNKDFDVVVTTNFGSVTGTFTTPSGTVAADAEKSVPEYIAGKLVDSLNAAAALAGIHVTAYRQGGYVYLQGDGDVTSLVCSSNSGTFYVKASGASLIRTETDLPARLVAGANGYVMAVGEQKLLRYYVYDSSQVAWLETAKYNSPTSLEDTPISLTRVVGVWGINNAAWEGRLAGDEDTNPLPKFFGNRNLTGMGAYQGRLVLLCGSEVYLSSSTTPRRFLRSTVTGLLDADPIAVSASANSSASYEYAVQFQKDLLLFSQKYQALIPSNGQAITPRTATVLLTSSLSADMNSSPVPIGRTLLFPAPRSADFFGMLEMISSQYTDSQYVANPATDHLPKYMAGVCRFAVSSPVSNMVLLGQSTDKKAAVVHEYTWSGDEKIQQAWHKWRFPYDVATMFFRGENVTVVFVQNGIAVLARIDPRRGLFADLNSLSPYLDLYQPLTVTDRTCTIPAWLRTFDPAIGDKFKLSRTSGGLAGEEVGVESYNAGTGVITTVPSFTSGTVYLGIPYLSAFSPTPPVLRDREGRVITSSKLTVLRFGVQTRNSAEYKVLVTDRTQEDPLDIEQATMYFSSPDLELGSARNANLSRAVIPCRTDAESTSLLLYTEGMGELNITDLDYTARYNQKVRRR